MARRTASYLLYVRNGRDGHAWRAGDLRYDPATKNDDGRSPAPGYIQPSWSPDGKYIAATRTESSARTS